MPSHAFSLLEVSEIEFDKVNPCNTNGQKTPIVLNNSTKLCNKKLDVVKIFNP